MAEGGGKSSAAWLAVAAGTLGSLMATLDTSIVNAALPTIQGEIGASESEGTWISTAYLVAEIAMIPLAGWFSRMIGMRRFLLICTIAFIGFSSLCGLSDTLVVMIIGRIGQGFTGGAMIPTALTIVATMLPPDKRPIGIALFGFTAVLGPVLGPVLGGYLTENLSWHYAFFINLPIGVGLVALLILGLPATKAKPELLAEADWIGIVGMTLFVGALTVVLEEGQRERWFESSLIVSLALLSALGFVTMITGQLISPKPVIKLRLVTQRSFGSVFLLSLLVGMALYGIPYVVPQFVAKFANYNAYQAGQASFVNGVPSLVLMIAFPLLVKIIDVRVAVGTGLLLYYVGCMMAAKLSERWVGHDFIVALLFTGSGQFFALLFLNQAATSAVGQDDADDASGLFNAARNLGGSIGLAMISTLRERRTTNHLTRLTETVSANSPDSQEWVATTAAQAGSDLWTGLDIANLQLQQMLVRIAESTALGDCFYLLGMAMLFSLPFVLLLKPLPKNGAPAAG